MQRLLLKLLRRRNMERDIAEELAFHREMAELAGNPTPFGNVAVIQESARDHWRFSSVENLWRDLVYGARGLLRSPGFTFAALASLALGIGANTAMFSLAAEFLLSEPSVRDASNVAYVRLGNSSHMKPEALQMVADSGIFESVAGSFEESFVSWDTGSDTERIFAIQGSPNWFEVLGMPVTLGRGWNSTDPREVVVLSHRFWRNRLGGDPGIIGKALRLNGRAYTVLGVLPVDHRTLVGFGFSPEIYVPQYTADIHLAAYARLKPGVSLDDMKHAVARMAEQIDKDLPHRHMKYSQGVQIDRVGGLYRITRGNSLPVTLFFALLLILVGLVLLIACVNVAGLILARASTRKREIAVRLSLGASRSRLLQQLMAESLLLSVAGTAVGVLLAHVLATAIASVKLPFPVPVHLYIEPDWRVTAYAAVLAGVATVLTGLVPAWRTVRESIRKDLQLSTGLKFRRALIAVQLAVSVVVLATGALFIRNLLQSSSISPGFDVRQTARADVYLPADRFGNNTEATRAFADRAVQALHALPGIESAAAARIIPFTDATNYGLPITMQDTGEEVHVQYHWNAASPEFFDAMRIPLVAGRSFIAQEAESPKAVIVNETFVRLYLGKRHAVGTVFLLGSEKVPHTIVGVAAPTKNITIGEDDRAQLYQPLSQVPAERPRIQFVVRSAIPPALQLAAVKDRLRTLESGTAVEVSTLCSSIGLAFLPSQVGALMMGSIGALGLLLAGVGLSGMMAYSVSRRTREIGIRLAIGADRRTVAGLVLRDCAKLVLLGAVPGICIALFVTRPLAMFLVPGLSPSDPVSFASVVLVLGAAALVASVAPLRRAISIDPAASLRVD